MSKPLVSIIIPAYNVEKFIAEAIESVFLQTYSHYEVIVVNDGSTDQTLHVLQQLPKPLTILQQPHSGIAKARNTGIASAKGEFIAFLDADDVWLPTKLEEQLRFLTKDPPIDMVFSFAQNTYDPKQTSDFPIIPAHVPPNCLFRRTIIEQIGLFDESLELGEFAEWYTRIIDAGMKVGCVEKLLILRRIHGQNIGIRKKHLQNNYVHILKKRIDRKKLTDQTPD